MNFHVHFGFPDFFIVYMYVAKIYIIYILSYTLYIYIFLYHSFCKMSSYFSLFQMQYVKLFVIQINQGGTGDTKILKFNVNMRGKK